MEPSSPQQAQPQKFQSPWPPIPPWVAALCPAFLTFIFYLPVLGDQFVNWDDPPMVMNNPHIRGLDPASIREMFTSFYAADWVPLSWFSLAVDFMLGQLNPYIYHLDSLLLHCANTLLVFFVAAAFLGLTPWGQDAEGRKAWVAPAAFLTSLGFGLHPLHVESVAWAAKRKDVLYAFFYLLSLWVYLKYSASSRWMPWKYPLCLAFFILSLLAKSMAVTFPLLLLLLDLWPLGRYKANPRKPLLEKIPFLAAALVTGWLTVQAQSQAKALLSTQTIPLDYRIMNAFHTVVFYLWKLPAPTSLAAYYPIQFAKTYSLGYLGSALAVLLISLACYYSRKSRPYLGAAWLFYLFTLGPVLGLIHTGGQAVMDHYTYLAILAPLMLLASAAARFFFKLPLLFLLVAVLLAGLMGFGTWRQLGTWRDSVSLWGNVLNVDWPNVDDIVYERLGDALVAQGRWDDALKAVDSAAEMSPSREFKLGLSPDTRNPGENRDFALIASLHSLKGVALLQKGYAPEAAKEFERDIFFEPLNAMGHGLLSFTYQKLGNHGDALKQALEAIRLNPGLPGIYNSLGAIYVSMAQYDKAVGAFQQAHTSDPRNMEYLANLASAFSLAGQTAEAIQTLQTAIGLQPQNPGLYQRLGQAFEKAGNKAAAAQVYEAGKSLPPGQ